MSNRARGFVPEDESDGMVFDVGGGSHSKKHGIDYDPKYVFGQAVGFLDAAGRCRPSGARDLCCLRPSPSGLGYVVSRLRRWNVAPMDFLVARRRVSPLRGLGFMLPFHPALPGWATLFRAFGAGAILWRHSSRTEFLAGMGQSRKNLG